MSVALTNLESNLMNNLTNTQVPATPTAGSLNDILSKAAGGNTFDKTTDSLEAIRDKVDSLNFDTNIYATLTEANVSAIADGEVGIVTDSGVVGYSQLTLSYNRVNDLSFGGGNCTIQDVAFVDYNKYIVAYADQGNSNYLTARCFTVSSNGVTQGTELVIVSAAAKEVKICKLDTNKAVLIYVDASDHVQSYILTTIGTTITAGAVTAIYTAAVCTTINVCKMATTKFAVTFTSGGVVMNVIATVSATTITAGSKVDVETATQGSVCSIGTDKIAVAYIKTADSDGYVKIATVSTTTPSFGSEGKFYTGTVALNTQCVGLTTDAFAIIFNDHPSGYNTYVIAATVSTTTPSFGTAVLMVASATTVDISQLSSSSFVATYVVSTDILYRICTVSGTTISEGSQQTVTGVTSSTGYYSDYSGYGYLAFCAGANGSYVYTLEEYYAKSGYAARQFAGVANAAINQAASGAFVQKGVKTGMSGLLPEKSLWFDSMLGGLKWRPQYYVDGSGVSNLCLKPLSTTIGLLP